MNLIATWSGGKDSCLAAYKAKCAGHTISYLANTVSQEYKRVRFHGVEAALIQEQATAIGIPLLQQETSATHYWKEFTNNLQKGKGNVEGVVFGDIFLEECYGWAQNICDFLGVSLIEPLWKKTPESILEEFIGFGFEAVIVSVNTKFLGKEWVGRKIDTSFVRDIQKLRNIDICGENGEYHSFVTSGPLFKQRIHILQSKPILRDGYWFLDIQKYKMSAAS